MGWVSFLAPFYKWGNRGTERLSAKPRVTYLSPQLRVGTASSLPLCLWAEYLVGPNRDCEGEGSRFHCPHGDKLGLACFRFHDLHRGATLPGMGPFHRKQRSVWEYAQPSCTQQSPVEEPVAQAAQTQQWWQQRWQWRWQPGPHRPRDWGRGAHCDWKRRPVEPARTAPCSAHWEDEDLLEQRPLRGWSSGKALLINPATFWVSSRSCLQCHPPTPYLPPLFFASVQKPFVTSAFAAETSNSIQ